MKCPRCKTVNENKRTICTKCGFYLYRNDMPKAHMTKAQLQAAERQEAWSKIKFVLSWAWKILVVVVMTFWTIVLVLWLASKLGVMPGGN